MKDSIRLIILAFCLLQFLSPAAESLRPNILVLIADDLGHADVGFAGGKEIQTPNLDKLAAAGAKLGNYYVQPLCTPTRAALLTGRYPMRYGMQVGVLRPWEHRGLPLEERTLPQALREAGYTTSIVGKWHLGHFAPEYLPTRRGFDHQYGHYCGQIDYFTHQREGGFDWHRDDQACRDEGYSTHLLAKEAVRQIQSSDPARPFFLYVPFNAVHGPHQVPEQYKAPYAKLPEPRRTYAGMLAAMDEAVGQIHAALKQRALISNTLIVFSSDNGGPSPGKVTDNGPFKGAKGGLYEGGVRVCAFATWEGKIKPGSRIDTPLHVVDWYPTLLRLAGASLEQKFSVDGRDIWPVLSAGQTFSERPILLNSTPDVGAVRLGAWKYISGTPGFSSKDESADEGQQPNRKKGKRANRVEELYNLEKDPSEKQNLASSNPEKLKALRSAYEGFAKQAAVPKNQTQPPDFKPPRVWGETDPATPGNH